MIKRIPELLIYLRLLIAIFFLLARAFPNAINIPIILTLLYLGILSDVFDGIIARKVNIATEKLRVIDTIVDLLFYASIFYYTYLNNQQTFQSNLALIICILILELGMYFTSIMRFRKLPSPHAILSKFWGLYLVVELTLLLLKIPGMHFYIALWIGLIVHLDRFLIYSLITQWEHDIPSSYHALLLRKGYNIKRFSLFN